MTPESIVSFSEGFTPTAIYRPIWPLGALYKAAGSPCFKSRKNQLLLLQWWQAAEVVG